jgi:hypothetical protein
VSLNRIFELLVLLWRHVWQPIVRDDIANASRTFRDAATNRFYQIEPFRYVLDCFPFESDAE